MDGTFCTPSPEEENCQATAFTVTFATPKTGNNRFIKRHIRNLSLPVVKVYDNKVVNQPILNGNESNRKPGNHSEGYFSSDPEDDHAGSKMSFVKHENSPTREEESSNEEEEERSDGAPSEAGTYTIDKDSSEIVTARLSIDAKFGVKPTENHISKEWVSDWALKTSHLPGPSSASNILPSKTKSNLVSKIPSPITHRARLGSRGKQILGKPNERSRPNSPNLHMPVEESLMENDTERFLKTTERAMSVLAARMSLSVDSEGESDNGAVEARRGRPLQRSDSSASESHQSRQAGTSSTRYNRAFSLRRGRLDEGPKKIDTAPVKPISPRVVQPPRVQSIKSPTPNNLSRNDISRTSIRSTGNQKSPLLARPKQDFVKKKTGIPGGAGGRSNSSLSSKEVEFQNWKRRKSYDPMKAAAEGKKKEAAARKSGAPPNIMSQSSTNATTTPKSPVNSVLRSASFHTTRQLGGPVHTSSEEEEEEEEEEETTLSTEEWPPKLSNAIEQDTIVPGGSRGSLYSNNSSGGSPRHRSSRLEGVDNFIVSAIATISNRVNTKTVVILKKLRFLFDEESDKYKELSSELELLEAGIEPMSSPSKSTSRDLAVTLKNLKRLDSAVKVLNEVLFENVEYQ